MNSFTLETETVLVLEGNHALREMLEILLVRDGYRVITAASGNEARMRARRDCPVDVLVTALDFPDVGGNSTAAEMRTQFPGLACVLLANASQADMPESSARSVILRKPFTVAQLREAIRSAVDERTLFQKETSPLCAA